MIQEEKLRELLSSKIREKEIFLVDLKVSNANEVKVLVDKMQGIKIEECVELSRWLTKELDLLDEDYSLEVSSPGLGEAFRVKEQYEKNMGRELELILKDGSKKKGVLTSMNEDVLTLEVEEKIASKGNQRKRKTTKVSKEFAFEDIKSTKVVIKF